MSEQRFRTAVSIVTSLIWTNSAEGMMEGPQPGWGNFTGQTEAEYQGYGWAQAVHPEDAQPTLDAWNQSVAEKRLFEFEHRVRRADGAWRLCAIRAVPLLGEGGAILEWVGVHTDITERRQAEANLVFLATVTQDLVRLDGVDEIMRAVGEKIGAHFRLSLCNFVEIREAAGESEVTHEWRRDDVPSTLGTYRLADWLTADFQKTLRSGELFVVRDTDLDPCIDTEKFRALEMRAFVCVPLVLEGEWKFMLNFHDSIPRDWRDDELGLMRELTARVWARLERLRVNEASRENAALFSTIIEQAPGGVYVVDDQFRLSQINAGARPTFATVEPLIGRDFTEVIQILWGAEVGGQIAGTFRRTLETGERYVSPPFTQQRQDLGIAQSFEWETQRITLPNGRQGVVCYFNDVTEQRVLEAALRASEQRATGVIQSIADGFLTFDPEWRITYLSPRGAEILAPLQKTTENVLGKDFWEEFPATVGTVFEESYRLALREQKFVQFEAYYPPLDSWFDLRAYPSPGGLAVHFLDVTERKSAEEALATQTAALRAADRSKDEFLAMLAHELRNPLAPLRNAAELLKAEDAPVSERAQAQHIIRRQIENMSRMLDDLLDVSRITEGKIELRKKPVALEGILTSAVSMVRHSCAVHRQELAVSLPAEPVYLEADATRLEQVFGNLLSNACKYSGEGCHISLHAERVKHAGGLEVCVTVRDDGAGIDAELLPRIFDLFVQASRTLDRTHGGLGIGLTLVQRLVKLHGGSIEAHSGGLGCGAEFVVHLPILAEAPAPTPERPAPPAAGREQPRRILIVDDNTDAARSLASLHRRRGHETRTAFTGPDAVAVAAEFLPEVVLLDIGLPGMDGFEVARRIRAMPALADALLIAMSGYGREEDRTEARLAGFDEYMVKPVDLDALRERLSNRI